MPRKRKRTLRGPPLGIHPQFRQVYAERLTAGTDGALLRVGIGSIVPVLSDQETVRRVVTDFEILIDPSVGEYLVDVITRWLNGLRAASTPTADAPPRHD